MNAVPWYDFNWFDYLLLSIVAISVVISIVRGFAREALSLVVWGMGLVLAFKFAPDIEQHIYAITHWGRASYVLGFFVIFISVWLIGLLLSLGLRALTSSTGLSFFDRVLGGCFGLLRGAVVAVLLLFFLNISPYDDGDMIHSSKIAPEFRKTVVLMDHYMPADMQRYVSQWAMGGKQ